MLIDLQQWELETILDFFPKVHPDDKDDPELIDLRAKLLDALEKSKQE